MNRQMDLTHGLDDEGDREEKLVHHWIVGSVLAASLVIVLYFGFPLLNGVFH